MDLDEWVLVFLGIMAGGILPLLIGVSLRLNHALWLLVFLILLVVCEVKYYNGIKYRKWVAPHDFGDFLGSNVVIVMISEWLSLLGIGILRLFELTFLNGRNILNWLGDNLWLLCVIGGIVILVVVKRAVWDLAFLPMIEEMKEKREKERIERVKKKGKKK